MTAPRGWTDQRKKSRVSLSVRTGVGSLADHAQYSRRCSLKTSKTFTSKSKGYEIAGGDQEKGRKWRCRRKRIGTYRLDGARDERLDDASDAAVDAA